MRIKVAALCLQGAAVVVGLVGAAAALCSEMAEIVQKVALVGSIDFGSSWLLFWE